MTKPAGRPPFIRGPRILAFSRRVFRLLPPQERKMLRRVMGLALVAAAVETLGVASIFPFFAVVMDPAILQRSPAAVRILSMAGVESLRGGVILTGTLMLGVLIAGNAAAAISIWMQQHFLARVQHLLSVELFGGYLMQPYSFHVKRDSASLTAVVFNHVNGVMSYAISPLVTGSTRLIIVAALVLLVVAHDPIVAVTAFLAVGLGYLAVYRLVRKRQTSLGTIMAAAAEERYRLVIEAFGGIKELTVLGRLRAALARFDHESSRLFESASRNAVQSILPRYLLETVAFGGLVLITVMTVVNGVPPTTVLPTLALYAVVGYRVMPALQQVFAAAVAIRFGESAVVALERDLQLVRNGPTPAPQRAVELPSGATATSGAAIRLEDVTFTYPGASAPALSGLTVSIAPNECVGIVGRTGSGKTTLVDLLLGLHEPSAGRIIIGGVELGREGIRQWRQHVGYVSQHVFLANASISENIAFGLPPSAVDSAAVRRAAAMAQAEEFIAQLPHGFETVVGERGVKLSGGQRQRLGIARALYHDPSVLVLDEATSALDGMTEEAVMDAIQSLSRTRTILLIAHRLRTVEVCDRLIVLQAGRVVADGTHEELRRQSAEFQLLAGHQRRAAATAEHASFAE